MEDDPLQFIMDRPTSSPEWLAMGAYGVLIYLYVKSDMTIRNVSTVAGYSMLILSKYLKKKEGFEKTYKIVQNWGLVLVILGLKFDHWRDAFAVAGYGGLIAGYQEANAVVAFVLALSVQDSHSIAMALARMALIVYALQV
jgi:heme exporter protein D